MRLAVAAGTIAVLAVAAPAARADIFAVADAAAPAGRTDFDVAMVDANTGARVSLPSSVNTTGDEEHPSISSDGKKLVLERHVSGTTRILLVSLPDGAVTDLFTGFEQASDPQSSPAISTDGTLIATGESFRTMSGELFPSLTLTAVSAPPFTRDQHFTHYSLPATGLAEDPSINGRAIAFRIVQSGTHGQIVVGHRSAFSTLPLVDPAFDFQHPAVGSPDGNELLVYDRRSVSGTTFGAGDIMFSNFGSGIGPSTFLPSLIDSSLDESRPAFSPDSRYLGFIRRGSDGHERVFVFDNQTQTLVNASGADLGPVIQGVRNIGNLRLFVRPLLKSTTLSSAGLVGFDALDPTRIGILVQRIVGKHKLFGKSVPKLAPVGRVPLGSFKKGRGHVKWDGRVNGRKLKAGRYQVTVRAVSPKGAVLDFGKPRTFTVR
jgi:WD40 repeat protein